MIKQCLVMGGGAPDLKVKGTQIIGKFWLICQIKLVFITF